MQLLIRHGLLSPAQTLFDYGCGRGGDVAGLTVEGYDAKGWDPHFAPDAPRVEADLINLGFVVNVIEDPAERVEALVGAFKLAKKALVVGVMLYGNDIPGKPFRDGYSQYLRHLKNQDGRPAVYYMLDNWADDLFFNYVAIPNKTVDLSKIEKSIINAIIPPVNKRDLDAEITSAKAAAF